MINLQVKPVIDLSVRELCYKPYPRHPKGCPNYGKRSTCPPQAPVLSYVLDLDEPVYCIFNRFLLAEHVNRMRLKHPNWSEAQLYNCLYWQGTARKQLKDRIASFLMIRPPVIEFPVEVIMCPEACGVNVTATVKQIGIELEWPPRKWAYQIALVGRTIKWRR